MQKYANSMLHTDPSTLMISVEGSDIPLASSIAIYRINKDATMMCKFVKDFIIKRENDLHKIMKTKKILFLCVLQNFKKPFQRISKYIF